MKPILTPGDLLDPQIVCGFPVTLRLRPGLILKGKVSMSADEDTGTLDSSADKIGQESTEVVSKVREMVENLKTVEEYERTIINE